MPQQPPIYLVASGDFRPAANETCWSTQAAMEKQLIDAITKLGRKVIRAHSYDPDRKHGFLASQREGLDVISKIPQDAPIVVAESVWQFSHHVYPGLLLHKGPILTVGNWSPTWPGLVGLLNLNGCLLKAKREFSTLWSEDFTDTWFLTRLEKWLETGKVKHENKHVKQFKPPGISKANLAHKLATELKKSKPIMGIFDEGCMGMYNALIPDELLFPLEIFKERLSQSALFHDTMQVSDAEAQEVYAWLEQKGMTFHYGNDPAVDLTKDHVLLQCKMYVAAVRTAAKFGCSMIGIQYQLGLADVLPASDLVEGILNNADRPPVRDEKGNILFEGQPVIHFNEVDEGSALDALLNNRVASALGQPVETTLHDVRWGAPDPTGTVEGFVWLFMISGAVPPAHLEGGWAGSHAYRQSPVFFKKGGATLAGIGRPGEIVWSRLYVVGNKLRLDIGRGRVVKLPEKESQRRAQLANPEWPVVNAILDGMTRDQFMGRHPANHIQIVYADSKKDADRLLAVKAAMAEELGIEVFTCGI
ncbi:MAG: fucose isomerase [Planctomycetaceae bacterium]|jgi:hypothetical protein|nr:fucose isomerase [Planctomycetaceae bacterium]